MIPPFESAMLFASIAWGLVWLSAVAVAGTVMVVGLVGLADRRFSPPPAGVIPLPRRLREAA